MTLSQREVRRVDGDPLERVSECRVDEQDVGPERTIDVAQVLWRVSVVDNQRMGGTLGRSYYSTRESHVPKVAGGIPDCRAGIAGDWKTGARCDPAVPA
jgi:hypothetical protein